MAFHPCGIRGCEVVLPATLLFCARHWSQLPLELRQPVNRAYARYRRQPEDGERLQALRDAQEEARAFLEGARV